MSVETCISSGAVSAAALAVLPDAALVCRLDGEIVGVNEPAAAMFATTVEDLTQNPIDRWLGVKPLLAELRVGEDRAARRIDVCGHRANGVPFPLRASVRLVGDDEECRAVWILRELDADDLVTVAQRFFDVGFDRAPIGMALFNTDGQYVRANTELCRVLGRSDADLIGRRDQELTHPQDRQSDLDAAAEIFAGHRDTHRCEKRFVRPDGSVVWTIASLTFLRDEAGEPLLWVGQFQDITARRTAEEAERRERGLSQLIIDSMSDGVVLTRDGRIVAVNDALCRLTGFPRAVLVGAASPYPFWPSERRAEILAAQKRIVDQGSGELELMLVRDNGERFPASVVTARAAEQDGPPAFVSTIRDISERKRQQDELERQATHDGLTGVLNRAAFTERMEREIASARAAGQPLSLALVDLDHFKAINDRHGHPVGDRVLAETAARLRAAGRAGDHLGRVGGEEFAWLFPGADADAAFLAAERARRAVEAAVVAGYDGVTLSIGVCTLSDATDGEDLYRLADAALYRAKALGRNQCAVHGA